MSEQKKIAQQTSTHPYYVDSSGRKFTAMDILFKGFKPKGRFKKSDKAPDGSDHAPASTSELLKNPPLK